MQKLFFEVTFELWKCFSNMYISSWEWVNKNVNLFTGLSSEASYFPGAIVCLTRVWQSLLPLFCDKTFEFSIQTWQTSLEHYYVYVQTYFLSQLLKMLILLISSYCKMFTLPTLRSVCCEQYKHARLYCWQWTHFTMGPNEQNQHFAELRHKICLYIHVVVLLTCLPSLDGKLESFVKKKWQKWLPNSSQTDYSKNSWLSIFGHAGLVKVLAVHKLPMSIWPDLHLLLQPLWPNPQ